ncbi:iron-sulfur cluster assembly protein [Verrucomicrobium sp. GAS474]|uniref:HesB/IscA family protein n=1 Tax=Verrucomicrobium sp. GAS474 TaxID=1882831 RepID=UPI00087CFB3F|nr:iron-sulfur cluster assembly accessory protein [Verrucomicrobium sp. GAS474]SDT86711.1 iron-sulfur cluster assembly protein [Verrucomicrobium sp. GAS474]
MDTAPLPYKIGNENLCRVSENAARQLATLLAQSGKTGGALRIAVVGGGCSGLQYQMDLVEAPRAKDILVESIAGANGVGTVKVVIDPKSALYVSGSTLDYSDDLQSTGFVVTNPNAASHCSCGKSFTV